jgi:hypothetical protein
MMNMAWVRRNPRRRPVRREISRILYHLVPASNGLHRSIKVTIVERFPLAHTLLAVLSYQPLFRLLHNRAIDKSAA